VGYKKTFFGYKEDDVKHHLRNLEKDYTQQVTSKRKELRSILDQNNKLRNQIDLVAKETDKLTALNRSHSKSINIYIEEIKGLENSLDLVRKEEERKRIKYYNKMVQKVDEFKNYCATLNNSMEELTSIIKRNKANGGFGNSQDLK